MDEARRTRRREDILGVAARVFAERGFSKTDLQIVADALRIGKGTVYRYFPSKHDLFLSAVDWGVQRLIDYLAAAAGALRDPLDQVAEGIRSYLKFFDLHPEFIELFIQERAVFRDRKLPSYFRHRQAHMETWKDFFRDLIRKGRIRNTSVEDILEVLNDLLYGTIFANRFAGRKESFEVQSGRILSVLFPGILSDAERERRRQRRRPKGGKST